MPEQLNAGLQKLNLKNPFSIAGSGEMAEIYYKETTSSTMNNARELLSQNPPTGTLVLASFQTAGKGRLEGRKWFSEKDESLMFTILIKNSDIGFALSLFPLFVGFCISGFLEKEFAIKSAIKWPNDVLVNGRKISGILCENSSGYVLCGIGLNCRQSPVQLGQDNQYNIEEVCGTDAASCARHANAGSDTLCPPPHSVTCKARAKRAQDRGNGVSIYELTGVKPDINDTLIKLLDFMKENWNFPADRALQAKVPARRSWYWKDVVLEKLHNKGKKITFYENLHENPKAITGIIEGIGPDGELLITDDAGRTKKYYSGEISTSCR
ncbi:MAG: biotin--[acetyl-CoA-carboxylase] ligase [Spirochaetes bacterium]|nr:biotin--[acetyl-CoA-carboxylase] ligase [Spirochaetota bacterium]